MRKIVIFLSMITLIALPQKVLSADYGLKDLLLIALKKAEKIQIAEKNKEIAEEGKNKRKAALLPRVTTSGSLTWFTEGKKTPDTAIFPGIILPGTVYQPDYMGQWALRVDQALNLYGKEIRDLAIAQHNVLRQNEDIRAQKEEYLTVVAVSYFETLRAEKNLEIAEAAIRRLELYRLAAEKRLKVGEVTKTVLLRAEGELSGALSDRVKAVNTLEITRTYLASLVGIEGEFSLKEELLKLDSIPELAELIKLALDNRPEIKAAWWEMKMAAEQVKSVKSGHWPSLALSGVYSRYDQSPGQATTNRESVYGLVSLNFPLFEGGLRMAEVREALIKERQAQLRYEDVKKNVMVEVETAYRDFKSQGEIIKALKDQLKFARENYQAVNRQFEVGLASSIDVMDAHTLLVGTERQLAAAEFAQRAAFVRLKRATGMLLPEIAGMQEKS
ncbi:MAG TPA: TolC family protein [Syntrophales bacterium]|nr:TolC family protein [Syntrophales bacterium]HOL58463.1 TolC family protein [Syntrophales bacterium]HPO34928.1 TolC family protein [Syntrophales bacterium]